MFSTLCLVLEMSSRAVALWNVLVTHGNYKIALNVSSVCRLSSNMTDEHSLFLYTKTTSLIFKLYKKAVAPTQSN